MRKLLFIFSLLILSCDSDEQIKERLKEERAAEVSHLSELRYFKDTRMNLCYAGTYIGHTYGTMTNVPCTPEVETTATTFASKK
jgi:hypothetical protein